MWFAWFSALYHCHYSKFPLYTWKLLTRSHLMDGYRLTRYFFSQSLFVCRDRPLALYIFANDKSKIQRFMNNTSSGGFLANDTVVHAAGKQKLSFLVLFSLQ